MHRTKSGQLQVKVDNNLSVWKLFCWEEDIFSSISKILKMFATSYVVYL